MDGPHKVLTRVFTGHMVRVSEVAVACWLLHGVVRIYKVSVHWLSML